VVERELIGGECAYWGCVPSKTLLRPPEVRCQAGRVAGLDEPVLHWAKIAAYRDHMVRQLDDTEQIAELERSGVDVLKRTARILAPDRVQAGDDVLSTDRIVVATGSEAVVPAIEGLAESGFWTNREATNVHELP
jgi:dihydrolipoamide dehydrogenase